MGWGGGGGGGGGVLGWGEESNSRLAGIGLFRSVLFVMMGSYVDWTNVSNNATNLVPVDIFIKMFFNYCCNFKEIDLRIGSAALVPTSRSFSSPPKSMTNHILD